VLETAEENISIPNEKDKRWFQECSIEREIYN
jgi:hypothetical protein